MSSFKSGSRRRFLKALATSAIGSSACDAAAQIGTPAGTDVPKSSRIASVRNLGKQFLENPLGVTGTDCASSLLLPAGDSLWIFGDTVEGEFESIRKLDLTNLRSNTAARTPRQDLSRGIQEFQFLADSTGKRPRQIVPFAADEDPSRHRIWAVHGLTLDRTLYLYYHRITLLKGVDVFANFKLDGMGIAKGAVDEFEFTRLTAPDGTREFWKGDQPGFGVFVLKADNYVYLWGSLMTQMFLARTKSDRIEDFTSYEYLVETPTRAAPAGAARWSRKFEPSAPLFDSVPNEMSGAYNSHLQKYLAIHSLHRENKIVMRTADNIVGPWSEPELIYRPKRIGTDDLIYAAKEHPELARDNGRIIYVTFVSSANYVPQLIEVTLR